MFRNLLVMLMLFSMNVWIPSAFASNVNEFSGAKEDSEMEDLLGEDSFSFDEVDLVPQESRWYDDLKSTLEHSQTHEPGELYLQRSSVRLEFERAVAEGWYVRLDNQYRYFWPDDELAERRRSGAGQISYGKNKWQDVWVQYSQGACAHKVGRQKLIWGEVEGTFAVDVITPFDYTEQLLTDYANIRLSQDMAFSECFWGNIQSQLFFVPDARTDIVQHYPSQSGGLDLSANAGREWGGRLKFNWEGGDVALMAARLHSNQPVLVVEEFQTVPRIAGFDFYGISSSLAIRRLLIKLDIGYKTDQLLNNTGGRSDRMDAAIGFEYTTVTNHNLNGGIWSTHYLANDGTPDPVQVVTVGWSKTMWNDDLAMSLLGNWVSDPQLTSLTLLADYQWDDYWSFSVALGMADSDQQENVLSIAQPDESVMFAVKVEF